MVLYFCSVSDSLKNRRKKQIPPFCSFPAYLFSSSFLPFIRFGSNTPRLAAHLSFRRKPESREKQAGCRIRSGMTKNT